MAPSSNWCRFQSTSECRGRRLCTPSGRGCVARRAGRRWEQTRSPSSRRWRGRTIWRTDCSSSACSSWRGCGSLSKRNLCCVDHRALPKRLQRQPEQNKFIIILLTIFLQLMWNMQSGQLYRNLCMQFYCCLWWTNESEWIERMKIVLELSASEVNVSILWRNNFFNFYYHLADNV